MAATPSHSLSFCTARRTGRPCSPVVTGSQGAWVPCLCVLWPVLQSPGPSWALCPALAVPGNWVIVRPPDPSAQTFSLLHCHMPQIFTEPVTPPRAWGLWLPGALLPCVPPCLSVCTEGSGWTESLVGLADQALDPSVVGSAESRSPHAAPDQEAQACTLSQHCRPLPSGPL